MAITFVGATSSTTLIGLPTHQAGDVLICFAFRDGSTTAPTLPAGWTNLGTITGTTCSARIGYLVALSSATTNPSWTNATTVACAAYRGVKKLQPLGTVITAAGTTNSINLPAISSMIVPDGTSWVVGGLAHRSTNTDTETPFSGTTTRVTDSDGLNDEMSLYDTNGGVTSWAIHSRTGTGTASGWNSFSIELIAEVGLNGDQSDDFDRANANLESSTAGVWSHDGLISGALAIDTNRLKNVTTNTTGSAYRVTDLGSADQWVEYEVASVAFAGGSFACCRMADINNWVGIRHDINTTINIYRRVTGTLTSIANPARTIAVGDKIRLEVFGNNYAAYHNGVLISLGAIGATLTNTRQGIAGRAIAANPLLDNFNAGILGNPSEWQNGPGTAHTVTGSGKMTLNGAGEGGIWRVFQHLTGLTPGATYKITANANGNGFYQTSTTPWGNEGDIAFQDLNAGPNVVDFDFVAPAGGSCYVGIYFDTINSTADHGFDITEQTGIEPLTVTPGAITLAGSNVVLKRSLRLNVTPGAITLAGSNVVVKQGRKLTVTAGAVALAGSNVTLRAARKLIVTSGAITLAGANVTLRKSYPSMNVTSSAITLAGSNVTLKMSRKLTVTPGSVSLAGSNVTLRTARRLTVTSGAITLAGQSMFLRYGKVLSVIPGAVTLAGQNVTLKTARRLTVTPGAIALAGSNVVVKAARKLNVTTGAVTLVGSSVTVTKSFIGVSLQVTPAAITLAGQNVTMRTARRLTVTPGSISLTGSSMMLGKRTTLNVTPAAITLTGSNVNLRRTCRIAVTAASVSLSGQNATLKVSRRLTVTSGSITLSGANVSIRLGRKLNVTPGSVALSGSVISLKRGYGFIVTPGSILLSGSSVTMRQALRLFVDPGAIELEGQDVGMNYLGSLYLSRQVGFSVEVDNIETTSTASREANFNVTVRKANNVG